MFKTGNILLFLALSASGGGQVDAMEKAMSMVKELGGGLKSKLQSTVKKDGYAGAVTACGDIAVKMAERISEKNNATIRRVSLRTRNPLNTPDIFEAKMLEKMEKDIAQGVLNPAYHEISKDLEGDRTFRFMKPIVTSDFCLNCHGDETKLRKDVAKELDKRYPSDKARGYSANQIRGAFSVIVPLDK